MITSESELYALGHNVKTTPLRSYLASSSRPNQTDSAWRPSPNVARTKVPSPSLYDSQVSDLGKSLAFGDDVVTKLTPKLISYSKAREDLKSLFQPHDIDVRTRRRARSSSVGCHNCGDGPNRHLLCHQSPIKGGTLPKIRKSLMQLPRQAEARFQQQLKSCGDIGMISGLPHVVNGESDTVSSPPPLDYLSECRDGARPVYHVDGDRNRIVLDNGTLFDKVLQETYPLPPSKVFEAESNRVNSKTLYVASVKGSLKWLDLPQPTKTAEDLHWKSADISDHKENVSSTSLTPLPPIKTNSCAKFKCQEFFEIFHSWCNKWKINIQLKDIADEEIILTDMHSLSDNKKMTAIASVALLAKEDAVSNSSCNTASHANGYSFSGSKAKSLPWCPISEKLVVGLYTLLKDTAEHVRVASAITLYCADRQNQKAEDVLLTTVISNSRLQGWESVQCLAQAGVTSSHVVKALISHVHNQSRADKVSQLLASLSSKTNLVQSLLSETLNSSGWLEKVAACQIIPILHGEIKKDVRQKLLLLAWDDWNPQVRKAAAQALGLIGHGKMVHDEISRRLVDKSETTRLDALKKLHSLNIMTAQLLPIYTACLTDVHTSIRIQAVIMAGDLKIVEPRVQNTLESLLNDSSWKVKVQALQSITEIGVCNDSLIKKLMWVIRYESLPVVRAKSCQAIAKLEIRDDVVVQTLQDILTVEDDPIVLREVTDTLKQLACSTTCEDDMLTKICYEIKQLGTEKSISEDILQADHFKRTQSVMEGTCKPPLSTRDHFNYHSQKQSNRLSKDPHAGANSATVFHDS